MAEMHCMVATEGVLSWHGRWSLEQVWLWISFLLTFHLSGVKLMMRTQATSQTAALCKYLSESGGKEWWVGGGDSSSSTLEAIWHWWELQFVLNQEHNACIEVAVNVIHQLYSVWYEEHSAALSQWFYLWKPCGGNIKDCQKHLLCNISRWRIGSRKLWTLEAY